MSWWDPNDNIPIEEHDPVKDCIAMGENLPTWKKVGGRCWLFFPLDGNAIRECEIVEWPENDGMFSYRIIGHYRQRPYIAFKADAFPTREALCEYYRKIFK